MTYKEKFHRETNWKHRVLTVEFFHLLMLSRHAKWTLEETAKYFGVSIALVSENLKLAHALGEGKLEECKSRDKALKELKK